MPTTTQPAPTKLYMEGNGRITCADLRCAGMTAHFNGMTADINGAWITALNAPMCEAFKATCGVEPTCECCGAPQTRLA